MIEYDIIESVFRYKKAKRTGLPYIRHIDQGLHLLRHLKASPVVQGAWCLHPLFQLDEQFLPLMKGHGASLLHGVNFMVVALAMEYRASANSYLTKDAMYIDRHPILSPVPEVNLMLGVDKVQNFRDAKLHLYQHISRSEQDVLEGYFRSWLRALSLSLNDIEEMVAELGKHDQRLPGWLTPPK